MYLWGTTRTRTTSSTPRHIVVCSTSSLQGKLWMIQSFRYHSTVSWIIQGTVTVMRMTRIEKFKFKFKTPTVSSDSDSESILDVVTSSSSLNMGQSDRSQVVTTWHQVILNSVGRHASHTSRRPYHIITTRP